MSNGRGAPRGTLCLSVLGIFSLRQSLQFVDFLFVFAKGRGQIVSRKLPECSVEARAVQCDK